MKIDIDIINRVLNNKASTDEAKLVNEWFTTDEGVAYLSHRLDQESTRLTDEFVDAWVDHPIPEKKMKNRFFKQIEQRRTLFYYRYVAAALIPFFLLSVVVVFLANQVGLLSPTVYADIKVPCGEQMQVVLQDGTTIQLNADTRLRYPKKFGLFNRTVELWGEGYFVVAKEHNRPFIVNLKEIEVKVTGTQFNIKAYPSDENISVTLDEGSVVLRDLKNKEYPLIPGETAEYNRKSGIYCLIKENNIEQILAWRSNNLNFYLTPLSEIIKVLERQYDVHFIVKDSTLLNSRFTLSTNKVNVNDVIYDLETVSHICFEQIDNETFQILKKE